MQIKTRASFSLYKYAVTRQLLLGRRLKAKKQMSSQKMSLHIYMGLKSFHPLQSADFALRSVAVNWAMGGIPSPNGRGNSPEEVGGETPLSLDAGRPGPPPRGPDGGGE